MQQGHSYSRVGRFLPTVKNVLRLSMLTVAIFGFDPLFGAELPTNDAPDRQIRFATEKEAFDRRERLIRFIWEDGLPDIRPAVSTSVDEAALEQHLAGVDRSLVKSINRLDSEILGIRWTAYQIHPAKGANTSRLAIVHAGHSRLGEFMTRDYLDPIHLFLRSGFSVVMMHMPQRGWHYDTTASLPNGKEAKVGIAEGHAAIVNLPEHDDKLEPGAGFRPFLGPVVACVNLGFDQGGPETDVVMIGLSGGGWTTHLAVAIDRRIRLSFPVAGSYPLYLRNADPASVGDLEQFFPPLYDEDIALDGSGGGVATWLEIYALGGFGEGRRQVMVTAPGDSCCFRGDPKTTVDTFRHVVTERVERLGSGHWEHRLDTTNRAHTISPWVIQEIVEPILDERTP